MSLKQLGKKKTEPGSPETKTREQPRKGGNRKCKVPRRQATKYRLKVGGGKNTRGL